MDVSPEWVTRLPKQADVQEEDGKNILLRSSARKNTLLRFRVTY
jgi:hypothetical protein